MGEAGAHDQCQLPEYLNPEMANELPLISQKNLDHSRTTLDPQGTRVFESSIKVRRIINKS